MVQNRIAKILDSTELQRLFNRIEINQTVRKGSRTGIVIDKFTPPGGTPEIWVLWHGSNLPVPEPIDILKFGKKISRELNAEIKRELNGKELITTVPWKDHAYWGSDEPLDPDDVWIIGEKVRWKRNGREGVVVGVLKEPILGGQLNYVVVRWFDTNQTLPIEPYSLWRLRSASTSEFNPIEPSEEKSSSPLKQEEELNGVELNSGKSSTPLNQGEELNGVELNRGKSSTPLNQGEELNGVELNRGKSSTPLNQGEELNGVELNRGKSSTPLNQGEELNGVELNRGKSSTPLNQGEELNGVELNRGKSSTPLNQGEELNGVELNRGKSSTPLKQEEELNGVELDREKSSTPLKQEEELNGVELNSGKSSTPLKQVEENQFRKRRGARGKQIASGCLHPYTKNKKLKSGLIATFPRVEGYRDPNNIEHWYWGYRYKNFIDGEWKCKTLPVPRFRVATVRFMIEDGMSVAAIKALIKGEFAND